MLTETQKAQIRQYLGYPDYFRYKHTRLESVLTNMSNEAEVIIAGVLAQLVAVEAQIVDAIGQAGVIRVDEIWFEKTGIQRILQMRKQGRMYAARLSIIVGVPIYSDVFGSGGYLGDNFSGPPAGSRGGGFYGLG